MPGRRLVTKKNKFTPSIVRAAYDLCDDFLPLIKQGNSSFTNLASMINRDRGRDLFLAATLTFLRFNKHTTAINPSEFSLCIDNTWESINSDQPNSLNLNESLEITHTDLDSLFKDWQWTDEIHQKKRNVFTYILDVYTQGMLRQSFLPDALAYDKKTKDIAKAFNPPLFSWDDSGALIIEFDTCPNNCYHDFYAHRLRITGNDITISLFGGLSYRLHHRSNANDFKQLKQRLIAKLAPWIDRRNDKFIGAAAFVLMTAAGAISLGLLLPDLNTLTIALLATAIAVTTLAASTFTGLGVRAHRLIPHNKTRQNKALQAQPVK